MKETKFTPGPWHLTGTDEGPGAYNVHIGAKSSLMCLASMNESHVQSRANSHLIAAAPELYSLLEVAACPCCDGSGAYYDGYGEVCQCQWCDERTKVIAKAGGEL